MSGWRSHLRAHGGVRVCAMSLGVGQTRPGAFAGCRQPEPLVPQRPLSNATGAREGWGPSTPEGPLGAMLSSDTTDTRGNVSSRPGPEMQTRRDVCPLTGRAARRPGSAIHARRSTLVGGRRRARRPSDSSGLAGRSAREAGLHLTAQGPPRGGGCSALLESTDSVRPKSTSQEHPEKCETWCPSGRPASRTEKTDFCPSGLPVCGACGASAVRLTHGTGSATAPVALRPALLRPEPPAGVPDGFHVAAHHAVTAEPCALPSQVLAAAGPSLAATSPGTHAPLPLAT